MLYHFLKHLHMCQNIKSIRKRITCLQNGLHLFENVPLTCCQGILFQFVARIHCALAQACDHCPLDKLLSQALAMQVPLGGYWVSECEGFERCMVTVLFKCSVQLV